MNLWQGRLSRDAVKLVWLILCINKNALDSAWRFAAKKGVIWFHSYSGNIKLLYHTIQCNLFHAKCTNFYKMSFEKSVYQLYYCLLKMITTDQDSHLYRFTHFQPYFVSFFGLVLYVPVNNFPAMLWQNLYQASINGSCSRTQRSTVRFESLSPIWICPYRLQVFKSSQNGFIMNFVLLTVKMPL